MSALTTDRKFVEQYLLPKIWDFLVPFDQLDGDPSRFFAAGLWIPLEKWFT